MKHFKHILKKSNIDDATLYDSYLEKYSKMDKPELIKLKVLIESEIGISSSPEISINSNTFFNYVAIIISVVSLITTIAVAANKINEDISDITKLFFGLIIVLFCVYVFIILGNNRKIEKLKKNILRLKIIEEVLKSKS